MDVAISATDPDTGNILRFSLNAPDFVTLTDNSDGTATLHISPGFDDAGIHKIRIKVEDNGIPLGVDIEVITVTVNDIERIIEVGGPRSY